MAETATRVRGNWETDSKPAVPKIEFRIWCLNGEDAPDGASPPKSRGLGTEVSITFYRPGVDSALMRATAALGSINLYTSRLQADDSGKGLFTCDFFDKFETA